MQQESDRWHEVILADTRRGAAAALGFAGQWGRKVGAWFRFVHYRKADTRFSVFGGGLRTAEYLAIAASGVLVLVLAADPLFVSMLADRSPVTLAVFRRITELGEAAWALYLTGALLIGLTLFPERTLGRRRRLDLHDVQLAIYYLFTAVAFSGLIATVLKNLVGRARPQFTPETMVWLSRPFGDHYDFASFPSGHATTAGALAMALALLAPRLKVFFLLAGAWIAISRPVLGVHFPSDILAGFAFGAWFAWIYARSFARKRLLFTFRDDGSLRVRPVFTLGRRVAAGRGAQAWEKAA